jgi:hypothetical protein
MSSQKKPSVVLGDGEVTLSLNGQDVTLRPTLRAAKAINSQYGGFVGIYQRIAGLDMAAYVAVIAAGLGKSTAAEIELIEEGVFREGMENLAKPIGEFVTALASGGRRKDPAEDEADGEDEDPKTGED